MDNWIFLFLGLLLGIPFSIFANFATPWVKSYIDKRNLTVRERKIDIITTRYKEVKAIRENPSLVNLIAFRYLATAIAGILFLSLATVVLLIIPNALSKSDTLLFLIASFVITISGAYLLFQIFSINKDAMEFDFYKEETVKKLKRLGITLDEESNE